METAATVGTQPAKPPSSREIAKGGADFADLLNAIDNGVRITGMILAVEDPKEFKGTGKNGKPYEFWNRKLQIWTGSKAVECTVRKDKAEEHGQIMVGQRATFRVINGRIYNGQLAFDIDA